MRNTRILLILGLAALLWITLGWLATNPVVGNHHELRVMVAAPQDYGLQAQRVAFAATDGIPLVAWWLPASAKAKEAHGTVILAHGGAGNRSHMLSRAAFLVRNAWNVLAVDLRMHGESGGGGGLPRFYQKQELLCGAAPTPGRRGGGADPFFWRPPPALARFFPPAPPAATAPALAHR